MAVWWPITQNLTVKGSIFFVYPVTVRYGACFETEVNRRKKHLSGFPGLQIKKTRLFYKNLQKCHFMEPNRRQNVEWRL